MMKHPQSSNLTYLGSELGWSWGKIRKEASNKVKKH